MSLPKVINLKFSQTVWELFQYRGDQYIMENCDSTLEHDMPTGPYLCLYQILSKYFKPHTQQFGLEIHSGEVTRKRCAFSSLSMFLQNIIKIFQTINSFGAEFLTTFVVCYFFYLFFLTNCRSKRNLYVQLKDYWVSNGIDPDETVSSGSTLFAKAYYYRLWQ